MSARDELSRSGASTARGSDALQQSIRQQVAERMAVECLNPLQVHHQCRVNAGQLRKFMHGKTRMTLGNLVKLEDWLAGQSSIDLQSNALARCADLISYRLIFGDGNINRADLSALARHIGSSQ